MYNAHLKALGWKSKTALKSSFLQKIKLWEKEGRKILKATGKLPVDSSSVLNLILTVLINILSVYKLVLCTTGNSSLAQCCLLIYKGYCELLELTKAFLVPYHADLNLEFVSYLPTCPSRFILPVICHVPWNQSVYIGVNWHSRRVNYSLCQGNIDTAGVGVFWLLERSRSMTTQRVPLHFPTPFWKKDLLPLMETHWHALAIDLWHVLWLVKHRVLSILDAF